MPESLPGIIGHIASGPDATPLTPCNTTRCRQYSANVTDGRRIPHSDAALDHLAIPVLAPEAYLRATVTNTSPLLLLPGQARVFHGAAFTGDLTPPGLAPEASRAAVDLSWRRLRQLGVTWLYPGHGPARPVPDPDQP